MRPLGPEPCTPFRSSPSSRAIRLARGEARSRPSSEPVVGGTSSARRRGTTWAGRFSSRGGGLGAGGLAGGGGGGAGFGAAAAGVGAGAGGGAAGFGAAAGAVTFSPFAPTIAIG